MGIQPITCRQEPSNFKKTYKYNWELLQTLFTGKTSWEKPSSANEAW